MIDEICKICNLKIEDQKHWWRVHKTNQKDYYETYYKKLDKLTNEKIEFKNKDNYFEHDFNSRANLIKWLSQQDKSAAYEYCKKLLTKRKEKKALSRSYGQFELKSLFLPNIKFFETKFGSGAYQKICGEIGLKNQFDYQKILTFNDKPNDFTIVCDTREQNLLNLKCKVIIQKLNVGDYQLLNKNNLVVERKSLSDATNTLSGGYDRFKNELQRAVQSNVYVIVLIESRYNNLLVLNNIDYFDKIKATPEFIMKRARDILKEFENVQFLAVDGRKEAVRVLERLFLLSQSAELVDLQYFYDIGLL